jgi:hypothetical protein
MDLGGYTVKHEYVCTAGMYSAKSYTVDFKQYTYTTSEDERKLYLSALAKWGFGSYDIDTPWVAKGEEWNVTHWFSTFAALRYMWETPTLVQLWVDLVYHYPDLDDWLLFCICHRFYVGNLPGHGIMSNNHVFRMDPVGVNTWWRKEPKGLNWAAKKGINFIWNNKDNGEWGRGYLTADTWKAAYDSLVIQQPKTYE